MLAKKARLFRNGIFESVPMVNIEVSKGVTDYLRIWHSPGRLAYDIGHDETVVLGEHQQCRAFNAGCKTKRAVHGKLEQNPRTNLVVPFSFVWDDGQ